MVKDVLLLMTEYGAEDTPLWYQLSRENIGNAGGAELGLSRPLRDDLAAWNDVWESAQQSNAIVDWIAHAAHAFELAGRVQLELGDDTHVWCAGGHGLGTVRSVKPVPTVVLAASDRGTEIEWWEGERATTRTVSAAGGDVDAGKAVVSWRSVTERVDAPFGDAATRAQGHRAAGLLQQSLGPVAQVRYFAGARSPGDYELAGIRVA